MSNNQYVLDILIKATDQASSPLDAVGQRFGGLDGILKKAAIGGGIVMAGAALLKTGQFALGMAEDVESARRSLIVATGATGETLEAMVSSATALRGTADGVGFSLEELGSVIGELNTRTGASGETLDTLSADFVKFNRLVGGDGVGNVQKITRVMGDWDVGLESSGELLDQIFGAGQAFGIGVDSLAGKLVQFGAPLRQMGFGLEESIAMLGKWEREGVNTELVIGSLRIAAGGFAKDSQALSDMLASLRVRTEESADAAASLSDALDLAENVALSSREFEALQERLAGVSDETEKLQIVMDSLDGAASRDLADNLRDVQDRIRNAASESEALTIAMEVFGARAGPDMAAAIREGRFELDEAVEVLRATQGGLDDAAERTVNFRERWAAMVKRVKLSASPAGDSIMGMFDRAMPSLERGADWLATAIPDAIDKSTRAIDQGGQKWAELLGDNQETIEDILNRAEALWDKHGDAVTRTLRNMGGIVETVIGGFMGNALDLVKGTLQILQGDWAGAGQTLQDVWRRSWDGVTEIGSLALDGILSIVDSFVPGFKAKGEAVIDGLLAGITTSWGRVTAWFGQLRWPSLPSLPSLSIPGFARGTNYAPGGMALVGEEGPELVQLPRGSRVIPAGESQAILNRSRPDGEERSGEILSRLDTILARMGGRVDEEPAPIRMERMQPPPAPALDLSGVLARMGGRVDEERSRPGPTQITIHVHGAGDPATTARMVEGRLRRHTWQMGGI
jgi:phage-related minor tail protein